MSGPRHSRSAAPVDTSIGSCNRMVLGLMRLLCALCELCANQISSDFRAPDSKHLADIDTHKTPTRIAIGGLVAQRHEAGGVGHLLTRIEDVLDFEGEPRAFEERHF